MKYDLVSIGDITTDAFIKIKDAAVHCDLNHDNCELCVRFGDKVPYEQVIEVLAVGNSANAAVSATRLGLTTAFAVHMGDDRNGQDCLEQLKRQGVSTDLVTIEPGKSTNYHYVLWYEAERTILIKQQEYTYKLPSFDEPPRWFYFSSVGENSLPYHHEIAEYVKTHPETKLAFQPGTFQIRLGAQTLADIYAVTEIFFCNKEEAQRITNNQSSDVVELTHAVRQLGPAIAIVTDGRKGAWANNGEGVWHVPMYPDIAPPVDRTGAGDSFSSTVTSMLALGLPLHEALRYGPVNSMMVVQKVGAQEGLQTRAQIEAFLAAAPADYVVTKVA